MTHRIRATVPTKEEIALLPPFEGIALERIRVPETAAEFSAARDAIRAAGTVGFDTESKPIFKVGVVGDGPHVVQFATSDEAFIFQVHREEGLPVLLELLQADDVQKVGFGLSSDLKHIRNRFEVELRSVVDLNAVFRALGFRASTGVRGAVALLFEQRLQKSKRQTTSNWALPRLVAKQLAYAANDAYAALRVHQALQELLAAEASAEAAADE
jgi:ribonuclease D